MKNKKNYEIEEYRKKIFESKNECRKIFSKSPFDRKLKISFELAKRAKFLKKFKKV